MPIPKKWFVRLDDGLYGPLSRAEVRELAAQGCIRRETLVSSDCVHWQPAEEAFGHRSSARRTPSRTFVASANFVDNSGKELKISDRWWSVFTTIAEAIVLVTPMLLIPTLTATYRWIRGGEFDPITIADDHHRSLLILGICAASMLHQKLKKDAESPSTRESSERPKSRRRGPAA